jgi:alkanesulfonate monooxygenase SsuD/methylene tetrahydromethanopterin reductase-like flavin-dependent oxidoreductase (luciferase family)
MKILRTLLNGEALDHEGEFYKLKLEPAHHHDLGQGPAFYFGGLSHEARECAAEGCDVYLMWPDTMDKVRDTIADMKRPRRPLWPQPEVWLSRPCHRARDGGRGARLCQPPAVQTRR